MPTTMRRTALDTVTQKLRAFFDQAAARAEHPVYRELWETARDSSIGGKLLRPRLVLLAHDAFADERSTEHDAVTLATAFELLHTALLLHDDVIDHDLHRRGRPNVIARRAAVARELGASADRARAYGEACSLLVGDLLISGTYRLIGELDAPAGMRRALIDIVDDALFATAGGEHADVLAGVVPGADAGDILDVMGGKTARYSFCAPLEAGALLGGAGSITASALAGIGQELGVAYQARDDLLGVFGDESVTGKSTLSDLREGKRTLLIEAARTHELWDEVSALFGDPELDEDGAATLRAVIELSGARGQADAFIEGVSARAVAAIRAAELPPALAEPLIEIATFAPERAW
jgi:geranylgeranyl pyrophosphate synthase